MEVAIKKGDLLLAECARDMRVFLLKGVFEKVYELTEIEERFSRCKLPPILDKEFKLHLVREGERMYLSLQKKVAA